jgi:putative ATPase
MSKSTTINDELLISLIGKAPKEDISSVKSIYAPLAARMRPQTLAEIVGQEHLLGKECLLPQLIEEGQFGSIILHGPPGCGKTTLAEVIANITRSRFERINAVLSNVAELRDALRLARYQLENKNIQTILFIDEIHRFNKAQQDLLLPDVEAGIIRLIGATSQNPGFHVNAPLLSRSHLFRMEPIPVPAVVKALKYAINNHEKGLGNRRHQIDNSLLTGIAHYSNGDLRKALNALETIALSHPIGCRIDESAMERFAAERRVRYDKNEDEHYDHISAFIKSIRGGDPDAGLYWGFKMLQGGEDPLFIARRLIILASEDIGMAQSNALLIANAAYQACERVGLPECEYALAHAITFLATSPKSNSMVGARSSVKQALQNELHQVVPPWLRDGHGAASKQAGNGKEYQYSHDFPEAISGQEYMLTPAQFYQPSENGAEARIVERLEHWRRLKLEQKIRQNPEST